MLIDDGTLPENFASKYELKRLTTDENNQKWYARYRSRFLKFGTHLCRLKYDQHFISEQNAKFKEPLWSDLLYIFYYYFTIRMIISIYFQYIVDYHKYKLDKFDEIVYNLNGINLTTLQIEYKDTSRNQLVANYEEARNTFKRFGAPFMNFNHIVETAFIFLLIAVNVVYLQPQLYYKFWKPFDYSIIYTIIAPERLQNSTDSLICKLVNNFIESSRTFNRLLINREIGEDVISKWHEDGLFRKELKAGKHINDSVEYGDFSREHSIHKSSKIKVKATVTSKHHEFLVQQVKLMALKGIFQPPNRRQEWLEEIAQTYGFTAFGTFVFIIFWWIFLLLTLPYVYLLEVKFERDLMDLLFHVELGVFGASGVAAATFYLSLTAMICLDQIYMVSELSYLIKNCILENNISLKRFIENYEVRVYKDPLTSKKYSFGGIGGISLLRTPMKKTSLVGQSATKTKGISKLSDNNSRLLVNPSLNCCSPSHRMLNNDHYNPMEKRNSYDQIHKSIDLLLVRTMMNYKIFVKQLRPALDSIPIFTTLALFLAMLPPVLTRLLLAYTDNQRKRLSILVCVILLFSADIVLVIICRLHARCLDIYRLLQSLMAHIVKIDHIVELQTGRKAYDKHLVWMLRKELNHPDRLVDQFECQLLGGQSKMTYANLMKYHFWWGVLTLSIITFDPTLPNTNDIFGGVWRFYSDADLYVYRLYHTIANIRQKKTI